MNDWIDRLVSEKKLRQEIANEVGKKMNYLCTCPNERDMILNIILDSEESSANHCNTDCANEDCDNWKYCNKTGVE